MLNRRLVFHAIIFRRESQGRDIIIIQFPANNINVTNQEDSSPKLPIRRNSKEVPWCTR